MTSNLAVGTQLKVVKPIRSAALFVDGKYKQGDIPVGSVFKIVAKHSAAEWEEYGYSAEGMINGRKYKADFNDGHFNDGVVEVPKPVAFVKDYEYNLFGEYEVFDDPVAKQYKFVKPKDSKYYGKGENTVTIPYGKVELGKGDFETVTPDKIQASAASAGRRRSKKSKRRSRKTRRSYK
jgi:hypothetical protein